MSRGGAHARATVGMVTLGCARNDVDSDQLAGMLARRGYRVVEGADGAEVVVVNTCTFITPATTESIDTVLAACDLKQQGTRAVLVVGCLAERYQQQLADALPEADVVVGFGGYPSLPAIVDDVLAGRPLPRYIGAPPAGAAQHLPLATSRHGYLPQDELDRIRVSSAATEPSGQAPASGPQFPLRGFGISTAAPRPWAYLKIASGCDRACSFCAIPTWRGRFRSRPLEEITAEARWLVERGARELVLVSENTTSWGKDLPGDQGGRGGRALQPRLLETLAAIDRLQRIRLMYLQPAELHRPLLASMATLPTVASYFDLSLQHVSAPVLARMRRRGSPQQFRELVAEIRELAPDAVFRSNFIVGFPGETDDDVAALAAFLDDTRLDWVGLFAFSPQEDTPAAGLPDQVPAEVVRERLRELSDLQEYLADEAAAGFVGRRLDVIVQETGEDGCLARSYREAPDTDGEIRLIAADGSAASLPAGTTVVARIVAAEGVDLVGIPDRG